MPGIASLTMCSSKSRVPTEIVAETTVNKGSMLSSFGSLRGIQAPLPVETGEKCIASFENIEKFGTA